MLGGARGSDIIALEKLKMLEYRGYDSFGFVNQKFFPQKFLGAISKTHVDDVLDPESRLTIAHTRWATHGRASITNTHPHLSTYRHFAIVHNGVVSNYKDLRVELEADGYSFRSDTDSEVIASLIEREHMRLDMDLGQSVSRAIARIEGEFAILAVSQLYPNTMICAKRKSPLVVSLRHNFFVAASDPLPLAEDFSEGIFLRDGEVFIVSNLDGFLIPHIVKPDDSILFDFRDRFEKLEVDYREADNGSFPDYMSKEMSEIPDVLRSALKVDIGEVSERLRGENLLLTGCGSAYYAAWIGQTIRRSLDPSERSIALPADELTASVNLDAFDAVLAISQSGETFDTIEPLRSAPSERLLKTAITNIRGSSLARISDFAIVQNAGVERCVLSTKSILSQCAIMFRIFGGQDECLTQLATLWGDIFNPEMSARIRELAESCADIDHFFHIGRGALYPVAMENALKLKEVTYCHAEGVGAGFFKHGTLSLIDSRFVTFAHVPDPERCTHLHDLMEANVSEIEAREGRVIRVGHSPQCDFQLPTISPEINPLMHLGFGQHFAYALAKILDRDVDMPRSLAKSVTVR
jgi:glucosamine--fructose-6-phosphate aminotransferase (isomerizing)